MNAAKWSTDSFMHRWHLVSYSIDGCRHDEVAIQLAFFRLYASKPSCLAEFFGHQHFCWNFSWVMISIRNVHFILFDLRCSRGCQLLHRINPGRKQCLGAFHQSNHRIGSLKLSIRLTGFKRLLYIGQGLLMICVCEYLSQSTAVAMEEFYQSTYRQAI